LQPLSEVIIVDDEVSVRDSTEQWLSLSGFKVFSFASPIDALAYIEKGFFGVIISDVLMPTMNGIEFMQQALKLCPDLPVILLTGHGDVDMATQAMRLGAYDFIEKPYLPERLSEQVQRACEKHRLLHENQLLQQHLTSVSGIEAILLGVSPGIKKLRQQILKCSTLDTNVIIYGETGTGKELVAQCLHQFSRRKSHNFVPINCGAIPESLIESELFGHERGAFTGASKRRVGKFEHAHHGTLLLDEIETMPSNVQIKILRALQEKLIERLGSNDEVEVDLRVIAASKEALRDNQNFRQDLFYRLNVSELTIPPLRQRGEDVPLLFEHYFNLAIKEQNVAQRKLTAQDIHSLTQYRWPGNVRELKNIALRYAVDPELGLQTLLQPSERKASEFHSFNADAQQQQPMNTALSIDLPNILQVSPLAEKVANYEEQLIRLSLEKNQGNIKTTLLELDLPRRTLNQKMIRYGINRNQYTRET
jgi:two-component system C4-dicarboxylate transport response regulator DctD